MPIRNLFEHADCFIPILRARQFADIAFDADDTCWFQHGADVIENDARKKFWLKCCEEHGVDAPARRAQKNCLCNALSRQHHLNVDTLDRQIIFFRISVAVRQSTTAIINRHHATWSAVCATHQGAGNSIKIIGCAGQARQADNGQGAGLLRNIVTQMQPQTISGCVEP